MSNKEPWLGVNLSIIFPGLGQLYSGYQIKGYIILLVFIAMRIISFWLICSSTGDVVIGLSILVATIFVWLWNLFDAYACAKSKNTQDFEIRRKQSKDPWLAMFLSQFLGIGYFYIGKWWFGLAIILILILASFSQFILSFIMGCVAYLAYTLSPVKRERTHNFALIVAILIIIINLFPVLIRSYILEARWIPSGAMEPTLHGSPNQWEADKILVDKFSYHYQTPKRGDIVVFLPTEELEKEQYQDPFIKRVIGLPGEKVQLKDGKVYINNKPLPEENYLSSGQNTVIDVCSSGLQLPFLAKPQTIPPDSYLVLGDNRNSSYDSRCWGVVPRQNIIGKAYKRFFPFNHVGSLE